MKSYLDTNQTGRFDSLVSLAATFAVPFLLLCSCVSVKPSTTKSGKKYFETFYVENGTQYFIKPLALSGLGSDGDLLMDFTFRDGQSSTKTAILNLSIYRDEKVASIDSLLIYSESSHFSATTPKLLFHERSKKGFVSRYTAGIGSSDITTLFEGDDWKILIYSQGNPLEYSATKETKKAIATLDEDLFALLQ